MLWTNLIMLSVEIWQRKPNVLMVEARDVAGSDALSNSPAAPCIRQMSPGTSTDIAVASTSLVISSV